jgi:hypothetical protein
MTATSHTASRTLDIALDVRGKRQEYVSLGEGESECAGCHDWGASTHWRRRYSEPAREPGVGCL